MYKQNVNMHKLRTPHMYHCFTIGKICIMVKPA